MQDADAFANELTTNEENKQKVTAYKKKKVEEHHRWKEKAYEGMPATQTPYARKMKKLRHSTVEPVLGTLINFLAMKRVNTRGIDLANKCMMMAALAYNLKKMMKFKSNKPIATMKALQKETNQFLADLYFFFFSPSFQLLKSEK